MQNVLEVIAEWSRIDRYYSAGWLLPWRRQGVFNSAWTELFFSLSL